jgi:hypothetical protein
LPRRSGELHARSAQPGNTTSRPPARPCAGSTQPKVEPS